MTIQSGKMVEMVATKNGGGATVEIEVKLMMVDDVMGEWHGSYWLRGQELTDWLAIPTQTERRAALRDKTKAYLKERYAAWLASVRPAAPAPVTTDLSTVSAFTPQELT